jgi:hypothetical protein
MLIIFAETEFALNTSTMAKKDNPPASDSEDPEKKQEKRPTKKPRVDDDSAPLISAPLELAPSVSVPKSNVKTKPIIVLLDQASIETVKNRRGVYELLNCDDHRGKFTLASSYPKTTATRFPSWR